MTGPEPEDNYQRIEDLEEENHSLREELTRIQTENDRLREEVKKLEKLLRGKVWTFRAGSVTVVWMTGPEPEDNYQRIENLEEENHSLREELTRIQTENDRLR